MAISLGDIKKKKITVSPLKNTNTNNTTYNVAPPINNQREQQTYNLGDVRKNNITVTPLSERPKSKILAPSPQVKMTIDSINNKINTNINQKIINGGIENDIHNMNMKNIGRTSLDKNIDLSGKSVMGKTTPVDTSDFVYNDTGKKYGDYFYQDYEKRKDEKIYKKGDNYFLYNDKLKIYEPIENINFMTTKEADEEEYKKAKELGYKGTNKNKSDKQAYKNTVLSLSDRLDLDTRNLSKNKYKEYEEDLLRQQKAKDEENHIINYGSDGTLIGGLKSFKSLGENFEKNIDKEIIYPIKHIKENYEVGKKNNEISLQYYNKMMGKTNNADELAKEKEQFDYFNKDLINNPGWVGTAIQNANTQIESLKHQGITATLTGGAGALIGTVVNPGGGTVAGAKIGGSIGYTLGSVPYTYKLEAGNQYKELTNMGVPHSIAKKHSQRVGVINAAIESGENIVDLIAFKTASGTKVIPKESITDLIDEYGEKEVKSWFREKLGEKTSDAIMTFAKSYGQNIWSESLEEMAQETTSIAGERLSTKEAGIDRNVSLEKDIIRILKAGESAAISTAFTGPISSLGGTIATNTLNHIETKIENKVVSSKDINETLSNEIMKSNKLISDEEIQNIQKEVYQELKGKNVKIISDDENTSNLPNNSTVEQQNTNNNINSQVNENVQNSMDTIQNNNIPENINNQQNNQLENLIEQQNINYSKNFNDRIDLEDYDFKTEQVIKSAERNVIVRNYRQLDTLIDEALDTQSNKALHFGRINETITQRIKRKLENLPKMKAPYLTKEKYDLVMNQSEIRHLIDEKTMMTREDVHKYVGVLPEIISNFDSASYSIEPDSEGIRFKKKLPDGNYISFVLVSNKQSTLKAKSIHLDKIDYETKKRSISPTNDVLKTPDRTSETDGAFASMKELAQTRVQFPTSPNSLKGTDAGLQLPKSNSFVKHDNTTISSKSQIAPLPQYNMQQNTKNDTTKIKPPIAKEYQKNTIEEKIEKSDIPDVLKISGDSLIEQSSNLTNDDIAQILTGEPETENSKNKRKLAILGAQLLDKGLVFENLSLKTKNRDLMGKWDYTLTSEARGQNVIGNGHYEFDSETKTKKQTSKSLYDIQKEVNNSGNTKEFYEYLYHKHNIDRMSLQDKYGIDNKPVFGDNIDAEYSKNIVNEYEENYPQFTDYAQDIYDYLNADRQELVKSGVITQELADYWQEMYPNYVPIRREDTFGNAIDVPLDTKRTSVNAPIKKAKGGNQNILPLFDTIAKRTLQTYKAVAKNNFGIELKNTLNSSIDTVDTNVDDVINNIDFQDELLTKGKNGSNPTFTVFENGKKVTFEITKDMYDALKPVSESSILSKTFKPLNKGMSIYRGILTEYNPVFMLTNSIKDAQDVLINSQHSAKTYKNIPEAYKQILSKGYWYQEYVSNGGEQNSYFDNWKNKFVKDEQNILGRIVKWPFKKVSQANNVIEMAPRLAEYIASRQEGRSIETSMLDAARVTTNFKAGGDTTKFINRNGGIFLNASVQGLMQNVRNVREARANGLKGWTNLATKCIIAGLPALILNNMVWDDDDDYNELADYVKDNYYIIAKYGDGKFIRIPKGRTIAVIQNAFTQIADSTTGKDEVDLDRFLNLATSNLSPNNPIENNIFSPIIQVLSNKTWYGEDLVPRRLQSSPNKQQYDETTDSFSKWLGNKLNISPYKIHYLLDQYSGGVGDVVLPMMTPKAENGSDSIGGKVISPLIDKFTTDSVMNNKYVGDFYDVKDKATQKAHSIDATEKDILMSKYLNSKNFYLNQKKKKKRTIQNSKLKDSEKYKKVREKQDEINKLAKQSIDEYKKVKINGSSATVGDITYRKDKNGEWTKVKDK